jgi:hypothetical protein
VIVRKNLSAPPERRYYMIMSEDELEAFRAFLDAAKVPGKPGNIGKHITAMFEELKHEAAFPRGEG